MNVAPPEARRSVAGRRGPGRHDRPRHRIGVARVILGGLLVAMATGQAISASGFTSILAGYRTLPPGSERALAVTVIIAEVTAGVLLLTGRRRRVAASVAAAVAVSWTVLAVAAFTRGVPVANCGCFGRYLAQPLHWWVLVEDVEFLALAGWVARRAFTAPSVRCNAVPAALPAWSDR